MEFSVLMMLPSILMALDYALMYTQFECMQKSSRLQGGIAYSKRFQSEKLTKWLTIALYTYVGIYILVQVIVMIGVVLSWGIDPNGFLLEYNILTIVLVIALNVNMIVFYCKNAGSPYKNEKMRKKVHNYAFVVSVWTIAFAARFAFNLGGYNYFQNIKDTDDFWYSVITFANISICDIVPFFFIIDRKFI